MQTKEEFLEMTDRTSLAAILAELSNRCTQATTDQLERAIAHGQRLVCNHLDVDHSEVWQASEPQEDSLLLTHLHRRTSAPPRQLAATRYQGSLPPEVKLQDLPLRTDGKALFPWIFLHARRGEMMVIPDLADLPETAGRDREMLIEEGIRAMVTVPLSAGGQWLGLLVFGNSYESRKWTDAEVEAFRLAGDVFANALARLRSEQALRESELRVRLAVSSTNAELWTLHIVSGELELGPKGRALLCLEGDERCDIESFLGRVHPDDVDSVRMALQQARATGVEVAIEYRVIVPAGKARWLSSRWQPLGTMPEGPSQLLGVSVDITQRRDADEQLHRCCGEIRELKECLKSESEYVRTEVKLNDRHTDVVGHSRALRKVLQQVEQVAPVSCPVLISGESGTGKELIAQSIHRLSPRGQRQMITVNCAALPAGLVESELFGRERGAFTGALSSQAGCFEMADHSTIFLDEIAEVPLELQGKLLRVLQEGEYARLGNPKMRKVDVRVIAATNRDLAEEVRQQRFREDLFYRLSVFPIHLPPLRERAEDIPLLVFAFLEELSSRMGKRITKVPRKAIEALERCYWPGNVRELRNVIERGVILSTGDTLRITFPAGSQPTVRQAVTLAEVERQHILSILEKTDWHIKGPNGAARILDLKPGTLYSRMRKLGVPHRRQKDGMPPWSSNLGSPPASRSFRA